MSDQIITMTFFRYRGASAKWWAFRQMGLAPGRIAEVPGLVFFKLLGSGGGNGFGILPNLEVYGLLCVWEQERHARAFFYRHPAFQMFREKSTEYWTIYLQAVMAHGAWDGEMPFDLNGTFDADRTVAILTRATIRTRHLWRFWQLTPPVSRSIENKEGLLFSVGVGEVPIVQQATFSLWQNSHLMKAYAYKSRFHKEVVRKTREMGWYKEELFARFHPFRAEGSWQGANPLQAFLPPPEP